MEYIIDMNNIYINGTCVAIEGIEMESYSVIQHCELAHIFYYSILDWIVQFVVEVLQFFIGVDGTNSQL